MSEASELGKKGEELAADHLLNNGYKLLEKNYVRGRAEVDIIAARDNKIVFVEVKTRRSTFLNEPGFMVPVSKQKQIFKAANSFLKIHNIGLSSRFDIISIVMNPDTTKIEHYEGAFYPSIS